MERRRASQKASELANEEEQAKRRPASIAASSLAKSCPQIENARGRSPWRFNLDELTVQPVLHPPAPPAADPPAFAGCRVLVAAPASGTLDFRRLFPPPARPAANSPARIGVASYSSIGCVPPACAGCSALPTDRWRSFSTRVERSFLRQGRRSTSDSHRRRPLARLAQLPAFTGCCSCPPAGSTSDLHRLFHPPASPAVNRSTFVERSLLRLGL